MKHTEFEDGKFYNGVEYSSKENPRPGTFSLADIEQDTTLAERISDTVNDYWVLRWFVILLPLSCGLLLAWFLSEFF